MATDRCMEAGGGLKLLRRGGDDAASSAAARPTTPWAPTVGAIMGPSPTTPRTAVPGEDTNMASAKACCFVVLLAAGFLAGRYAAGLAGAGRFAPGTAVVRLAQRSRTSVDRSANRMLLICMRRLRATTVRAI